MVKVEEVMKNKALLDYCKNIIKNDPFNIQHFPVMQANRELAEFAVRINGLARFFVDPQIRSEIAELSQAHLPAQFFPEEFVVNEKKGFFIREDLYQYLKDQGVSDLPLIPVKQERNEEEDTEIEGEEDEIDGNCSEFLRDSQVLLMNGELLIPYNMKNKEYERVLVALCMRTENHFIEDDAFNLTGKGFYQKNTDAAMIRVMQEKIPYRRGKTCIEGGNCFLFEHEGQNKAIIGELSLFLSMLALIEQNYFEKLDELQFFNEPSEEGVRIARNYSYYLDSSLAEDDYVKALIAPIEEDERIRFKEAARRFDSMLDITKKCIAEELDMQLANIAFIPQADFHIDMELSVTPDGEIFLDDYSETEQFLNKMKESNLTPEERALCEEYIEENEKKKVVFEKIQQDRIQRLNEIGLKVIRLPLILSAPNHGWILNYCNGIFAKNSTSLEKPFRFVTTGPTDPREGKFHNRIVDLFHQCFPKIELTPIPNMSETIARCNGGIHCATAEVHYSLR